MIRLPDHEYTDIYTPFPYLAWRRNAESIRYIRYHWFNIYKDGDEHLIRIYGNPAVN